MIQLTGSNTHNNGQPGGDGQTGDAGEGTGGKKNGYKEITSPDHVHTHTHTHTGTDRHNIVEIPDPNSNFPSLMDQGSLNGAMMFKDADVVWSSIPLHNQNRRNKTNVEVAFASAGYYHCLDGCTESVAMKTLMNRLLNNAPASFEGAILRFRRTGTYHYISSRNNNFTNRSQKGKLTVKQP